MSPAPVEADFAAALSAIRNSAPLIHNMTNIVVANLTANALLALGASPAMVENTEEAAELAAIAGALVVNLGTLSPDWAAAMRLATLSANAAKRPWLLDPVAVGALGYRTRLAADLLRHRPAIIRGNASEISALAGYAAGGKGVDSTLASDAAVEAAQLLARNSGAVVVVSGAVDYVTDGSRVVGIANGHAIMSRVTGMGCTASAIGGAYLAVIKDPFRAAVLAMVTMGVAGEAAFAKAQAPGTFQTAFIDALYQIQAGDLAGGMRLS
ncbi:hydroxyethylthiazole kinase [Dongia rigui]|uniref:Hydroxyethylthiazole kinase n=1 Tax=Dongia rigui TaxID=940149 RepID=A0ABU5DSY9_9PROT|nr:hydroxyethylthiazole kinase [Dongia rigui]MDY0870482.1 hydroxyethylthiazole kinase [Dongia rigui]